MSELESRYVTHTWTYDHTSVRARLVTVGSRVFAKPVIRLWARYPRLPWPYGLLEFAAAFLPAIRGVARTRVVLRHCGAERLRPVGYVTGVDEPRAMLYLHGGALAVGGIRSHRRLLSRLVHATGVPSLAVDYRQLPSSSVSVSLSDCLDGLQYLLDSGIEPRNIAVVGDSAGGYLALQVALEAQRRGIEKLGAVACISPIIDLEPSSKLAYPHPDRDPLFPPQALDTLWRLVTAAEGDITPLADIRRPAQASTTELASLPPLLIQVGSGEILRPDADALVAQSVEAGADVRLDIFAGQIHVFHAGADFIPEARLAIDRLSAHIVAKLGQSSSDAAA